MESKQEIIDNICSQLGITSFPVSSGSTESKDFLFAVADQLGLLKLSGGLDKPSLGKLIVEASGFPWQISYESEGGTITREGLNAIRKSVFFLVKG